MIKTNIITHIDYDDYGRQDKDYLPYVGSGSIGLHRTDALTATNSFYFTAKYENTTNPFSEKHLEASPLSRILEQGAPGADWAVNKASDTDHTIKFEYQANTSSEVKQYGVTLTFANSTYTPTLTIKASNNGFFEANELYKTITKDENHDGTATKAHTTEEFKDKQGRVILKRTYGTSVVNDVPQTNTAHDTYYVYDDFGNLTYVLPPKSEPNMGLPDATKLSELCYQYKYDDRNRLVEKKTPGKDWEYIVYNNLDQPVLTQDALQRPNKHWLFTKYDVFGRVVYTGIYTHGTVATRAQMVTALKTYYTTNASEDLFEEKVASEGSYHYYSNGAFPNTGLEVLTVNYYDNYSFDKDGLSLPSNTDGQTVINYNDTNKILTQGLATGSKVKVLTTNDWITALTGYDVKGRPVYVASKNNYLLTTDIVTSKLDFVGKVDKTTTSHSKTGQTTITTQGAFVYDHEGRLLRQKQTINNLEQETIVDNSYDNLGQLESKGVGGKSSNVNRLQEINYTYNVRGWLKGINDVSTLGTDLFSFKINYNKVDHSGTKLYNGNIAETEWKTQNDNILRHYVYSYDALNRITVGGYNNATSTEPGWFNISNISYDKNGNLLSLNRAKMGTSSAGEASDYLTYFYDAGNKLLKVEEQYDGAGSFEDGTNTGDDYDYDVNGNLIFDANKRITSIEYNHLNLPTEIQIKQMIVHFLLKIRLHMFMMLMGLS